MKKIFVLILMLFSILIFKDSNAQFKIGNISLKDSNRVLVINAPASFWATNWIKLADLPSTIAGKGLVWDNALGIDIVTGTGLKIENDTLKTDLSTILTTNDTTIYINSSGQVSLRVAPNYGLTKDMTGLAIDLSTNSGLTFSGNSLTTNLDSGITVSGNKLKIKTDASVVGFDGSGNLKILPNSITETQISKDINLDSIKIGGLLIKSDGDRLNLGDSVIIGDMLMMTDSSGIKADSLGVFMLNATQIYINRSTIDTYDGRITSNVNGDLLFYTTAGDKAIFGLTVGSLKIEAGDIESNGEIQSNSRYLSHQSDTDDIGLDSVITISNGNFIIVTNTASQELNYITTTGWTVGSIIIIRSGSDVFTMNHGKSDAPVNTLPIWTRDGNRIDFDGEGQTVMLVYDGTGWREVSRGVASP